MSRQINDAQVYDGKPFFNKAAPEPMSAPGIPDGPINCMTRLKMVLRHKAYCSDAEYEIYLGENDIYPDEVYDKDVHQIGIYKTVLAILEPFANDISLYMKVELAFGNQGEAYTNLQKQISEIKRKIRTLQDEQDGNDGCFTSMFYTHKKKRA